MEAGKLLAEALKHIPFHSGLVLAIPRGGVVTAFEVAEALNLPLDIIVPRKIGAPDNPELAIGAVTEDGTVFLDDELVSYLGVTRDYIKAESERQREEITRRMQLYRHDLPYPELRDRDVIVVDDGIATGSTMKAALSSVRNCGASSVTVAIPVGPPSTIAKLKNFADRIICLLTPEYFSAIGEFYRDFSQTTDEEVIELLSKNRQKHPDKKGSKNK